MSQEFQKATFGIRGACMHTVAVFLASVGACVRVEKENNINSVLCKLLSLFFDLAAGPLPIY